MKPDIDQAILLKLILHFAVANHASQRHDEFNDALEGAGGTAARHTFFDRFQDWREPRKLPLD